MTPPGRLQLLVVLLLLCPAPVEADSPAVVRGHRVKELKITVLSTMLADDGIGEWGFSALVEADGQRVLFDTGARPGTVLENARELSIDLSGVRDVVLSHNHDDHTGGLLTLRREIGKKNPQALSRAHVAPGIFYPRTLDRAGAAAGAAREDNPMLQLRPAYQEGGGAFVEHAVPAEILPGVYVTGSVPRPHPERNFGQARHVRTPRGLVPDEVPEDQSLVIDTDRGLVVLTGCGHAGLINTLSYARKIVRDAPIHAALGGFHLYQVGDRELAWTAERLRELRTEHILGAHCTGIEAVYRLRQALGLSRAACVVGAVGASFDLAGGIRPRRIAR